MDIYEKLFEPVLDLLEGNPAGRELLLHLLRTHTIPKEQVRKVIEGMYDPEIRYDSSELYRRAKNEAINDLLASLLPDNR